MSTATDNAAVVMRGEETRNAPYPQGRGFVHGIRATAVVAIEWEKAGVFDKTSVFIRWAQGTEHGTRAVPVKWERCEDVEENHRRFLAARDALARRIMDTVGYYCDTAGYGIEGVPS